MGHLRLSALASEDILNILVRAEEQFGEIGRLRYEALLETALRDVAANPERVGSVARPEIGVVVRIYHIRHSRLRARTSKGTVKRPRHFFLYRAMGDDVVEIGRILHDVMDLEQHLPADYGQD